MSNFAARREPNQICAPAAGDIGQNVCPAQQRADFYGANAKAGRQVLFRLPAHTLRERLETGVKWLADSAVRGMTEFSKV
jgi:hypothetical protein